MIMTFTVICYKVYIKSFQGRWEELDELAASCVTSIFY